MKKYEVLLFDVDGTLLNFDAAERDGIEGLLKHFEVPVTEENIHKYHVTNKRYWEMLERGGNNAGIDAMWYNPHGVENTTDVRVEYVVGSLDEMKGML